MNMRQHILRLWLVFGIAVLAVSCSGDDSDNTAESAVHTGGEAPTQGSLEKENASGKTRERPPRVKLATKYKQECADEEEPSLDCAFMHSLLVAKVVIALGDIQRSRDQRGTEQALKALDLTWEPDILIAACRVLGYFPDTPGIAEKALPLMLDSPYLAVEQAAAQLLGRNPDPALAATGRQWSSGHGMLWTDNPYAPAPDFPEQYFDMGFPDYPDAAWFDPADSDRSVGWWVEGAPADISAWFAKELGVEILNQDQWTQLSSAEMMSAYQSLMSKAEGGEMQQLTEKYIQTQDPALMERMQKLSEEMTAQNQKLEADFGKNLNNVLLPPSGSAVEALYYLVAEETAGHISRAILVFRYEGSERTVMQMAWDLRDYPPAWPVEN